MSDADLTHPAGRIGGLIAPVLAGAADMVAGDRHSAGHYAAENKRPWHGAGNALVRWLVSRVFRANLAASSVIAAVILVAVGLILDSVAHQQRKNYELAVPAQS